MPCVLAWTYHHLPFFCLIFARSPWNNWHSSKATINVPNDNPLSRETFFKGKSFANDLERLVEGAIDAWTDSRLGKALGVSGCV